MIVLSNAEEWYAVRKKKRSKTLDVRQIKYTVGA